MQGAARRLTARQLVPPKHAVPLHLYMRLQRRRWWELEEHGDVVGLITSFVPSAERTTAGARTQERWLD